MTEAATETRIVCQICKAKVHSISYHLKNDHPEVTQQEYEARFPGAPLMSEIMRRKLDEQAAAKAAAPAEATAPSRWGTVKKALHEVFGVGPVPEALNAKGKPIMISVCDPAQMSEEDRAMIPAIDPNYVFNLDVLRTLIVGVEKGIPTYLWGHAGTGKTTMWEQIFARLGRPVLRVQHTANMEESHVTGQYVLRDGATEFEAGPLMVCMQRGWVYLADEYDFGRPEVLSVYQPVLEGKRLIVKEAPMSKRITEPAATFFFCATGNTNGTGDETNLYAGTNQQNAANYERYGITERMPYMAAELEARVVSAQGGILIENARKLVDFAGRIRTEFEGSKMGSPISPRTLIFAAQIGRARGSYRVGLEKAFINRLSSVDREAATQLANRVFGTARAE